MFKILISTTPAIKPLMEKKKVEIKIRTQEFHEKMILMKNKNLLKMNKMKDNMVEKVQDNIENVRDQVTNSMTGTGFLRFSFLFWKYWTVYVRPNLDQKCTFGKNLKVVQNCNLARDFQIKTLFHFQTHNLAQNDNFQPLSNWLNVATFGPWTSLDQENIRFKSDHVVTCFLLKEYKLELSFHKLLCKANNIMWLLNSKYVITW